MYGPFAPPQGLQATGILASTISQAITWSANQTFSAQILAADGTAASPSYSFSNASNRGLVSISTRMGFVIGGVEYVALFADTLQLKSSTALKWSSGVINSASDTELSRGAANHLYLASGDSFSIGATAIASGTHVLQVANGTAPSSQTADSVSFFSTDDTAGNTVPSFFCEGTGVLATGQADSASSVRVKMRINGTVVTLLAI